MMTKAVMNSKELLVRKYLMCLRFALKVNRQVEEGFHWIRRPQLIHRSSWRDDLRPKLLTVKCLERYQVTMVLAKP